MSRPAAKMGDTVVGVDIHIILIPAPPAPPIPTPLPHPFNGKIMSGCSTNVLIEGKPAAVQGAKAMNIPPHIPMGGPFQKPPSNQGTIMLGSMTVLINNKPAARTGDMVMTCNDPADAPTCSIVAVSTVLIGG